jgi:putative flippase GtrA
MERPAATLSASRPSFRRRAERALRARSNWEQLVKFCMVGAVGYVINLAVYASLLSADVHYLAAATCSFLIAVANNYTLNRVWTFHDRRAGVARQGMQFLLISIASLGANLLVLHLLITAGLGKLVAQAVAIVLVTPLNFVGNKLWSFRRR